VAKKDQRGKNTTSFVIRWHGKVIVNVGLFQWIWCLYGRLMRIEKTIVSKVI